MFPTIDRCAYPVAGAYLGMVLPDHGEVWSQAWKHEKSTEAIHLTVQGRALPYTLSRTIGIIDERRLCLSYEVVNTGAEPLSVLWVAHPQFVADEATRIVLPVSVKQVVSVLATAELPVIGQHYDWATATTQAGESLQLDRIRAASTQKHRKLYLPPDQRVEWAGLQHGKNGAWLRLSWDASEIPYLGIWVDEGSFNSAAIVALEPSTGYYDALSLAWQNQRAMVLPPGLSQHWSLNLELGNGVIS
jgi:galactose mutarotase-like enzyme